MCSSAWIHVSACVSEDNQLIGVIGEIPVLVHSSLCVSDEQCVSVGGRRGWMRLKLERNQFINSQPHDSTVTKA